ncbi:hypothetical protein LCGC14_1332250 [marine sediment metagenome]|uniref:Uncharacterized protein n=1 Tax=marine sediment metagenome TaxID=412755 RepID=A0A0F9NIM7_9ZZZZ
MAESDNKLEADPKNLVPTQGRGSEICLKTRITAAGNIKGAPGKLYWLILSNSSSSMRHATLHDDTDGTDDEVAKFYLAGERTVVHTFDPPIPFSTGIRFGNIEHDGTRITAGYI